MILYLQQTKHEMISMGGYDQLREGRDPTKHIGWGIHDCHSFFSPWLTCRLFQQDKWTTFNPQQFLSEKALKNQKKYFHIWLQRLK